MPSRDEELTKGAFLKQKLENMAKWVTDEVGKENLPVDVIAGIAGRSELEVTVLAGALQSNKKILLHRDFGDIIRILEENKIPRDMQEVIVAVKNRESMHEKFWRYISLFIDVASQ